ncbi:uncharacterized mitochondrial protein AtMg00310-like [Henckelia pumila]|uniref:uncharacterized mitochondrial protein AtMg00310-like n=1 Tax=Henckelia pumila TaxID=405737 RepID=UPI003C6DEDB6
MTSIWGLPTMSLRNKRLQFKYLVERVVKRIQGWIQRYFSVEGKEVLIKSVLQSIPTYAMSCFRILKSICDYIEGECANFWWGVEGGRRKMHWKSWDFLCQPKLRGGLGFRKMDEFNRALLAKQFWRLLRNQDSLVFRVLKGRYFKHGRLLDASLGNNPSYIWSSFLWSKEILTKGLVWRVGDGAAIDIYKDIGIPSLTSKLGQSSSMGQRNNPISSLIKNGSWDQDLISHKFNSFVADEIVKIPLTVHPGRDINFGT